MSEYIISEKDLRYMRRQCYEAGKIGKEVFIIRDYGSHEIIRCRDCGRSREKGWKCTRFSEEIYDEAQEVGELVMANTRPDGYCFWAEKRESCDI